MHAPRRGVLRYLTHTGLCLSKFSVKLKYLGVTTNKYAGDSKGWDDHAECRGQKMLDAFYIAGRRGMRWNTASAGSGLMMFDKIFTKIATHGGEIWDHNQTQTKLLDRQMAKIIKTSLNMHPRTPTQWILWETNTIPSAIAIDMAKARAWRTCKIKQKEGFPTPPHIIELSKQALGRLGYRKDKWIVTELEDFRIPSKEKWNDLVTTWGRQTTKEAFHTWWENPTNDKDREEQIDMIDLKPGWGDIQVFIKNTREFMGFLITLLFKSRANSLGLKGDATVRAKDKMLPDQLNCQQCTQHVSETLPHTLL